MIDLSVRTKYEAEVILNELEEVLIKEYGIESETWPTIEINNRLVKCKGCMEEFMTDEYKRNIFDAGHKLRVLFKCPNCGTCNSIRKHRLEM